MPVPARKIPWPRPSQADAAGIDTEEVLVMRLSPIRAGLAAVAFGTTLIGAGAVPALAAADSQGTTLTVAKTRLNVRAGRKAVVVGRTQPGRRALLQIRRDGHWYTIHRDRAAASGRFALRDRRGVPMSTPVRVRVGSSHRRLGRLDVYRTAYASWYGPGLYGGHLACGGTLYAGKLGVAHKTLPCGTRVTLRHHGRKVRVPVIDRGPYVGGREYDLTEATAQKLGFRGHGGIQSTK
jgi:rare lipoprotein A